MNKNIKAIRKAIAISSFGLKVSYAEQHGEWSIFFHRPADCIWKHRNIGPDLFLHLDQGLREAAKRLVAHRKDLEHEKRTQ